ncbi:hypothetical protein HJD18_11645 [Thermoleophilia bacterium SCSIO 60948]|nr:hypothetical protein HJD18_11645 [Thermoleophilia bacterium SCSIO 60948]
MTSKIRMLLALMLAAVLALGAIACGDDSSSDDSSSGDSSESASTGEVEPIEEDPANGDISFTIGSKNFTEQFILGNIYAQAFEAAGYDVDTELNLGSEVIANRALRDDTINAYPEYTGTVLANFYGYKTDDIPSDADEAYELVKESYAEDDITVGDQTPFNNTYVVASLPETQEEIGGDTITDIADSPDASDYSIAGFPECRQRTDCLVGLDDVYGWTPEFVSTEAKYEPLDDDQSDFSFAFGTDGELASGDYAVYEDDKGLFPPYHIVLAMDQEMADAVGQDGIDLINEIQAPMTEEVMQELNARVDIDKEEPEDVATQYLQESGFIE